MVIGPVSKTVLCRNDFPVVFAVVRVVVVTGVPGCHVLTVAASHNRPPTRLGIPTGVAAVIRSSRRQTIVRKSQGMAHLVSRCGGHTNLTRVEDENRLISRIHETIQVGEATA